MFYISGIYDYANNPIIESSYSDISLVVVRNTQTDFYREFTNAYDIQKRNSKIAGVGTTYLHAFNQYEIRLLQMLQFRGVDTEYPRSSFQKLPNTLQYDYLSEYDVFNLYKDTHSTIHYTILDLIPTQACCVDIYEDGSAIIFIYCCFGNDFVQYYVRDYKQFIIAFTKYNVLMKGRR